MGIFDKNNKSNMEASYDNILGDYYSLEELQPIFCGKSGITLSPLGWAQIMDEHYPVLMSTMWSASTNIQQFFPSLDYSTPEKVKAFMISASKVTELGVKFAYVITVNHIPAGMFILTTPYLNNKEFNYDYWTMDFFLFSMFEGKGIMSVALPWMLQFLQGLDVADLHLIVDENNTRCLNLLANLPVDEIDNSFWHSSINGRRPKVFSCPLAFIDFQRK